MARMAQLSVDGRTHIDEVCVTFPRLGSVWKYVHEHMEKELFCHLQFVLRVAMDMVHEYPWVHKECVFVASLMHDIGRPHSSEVDPHEWVGARMVYHILPWMWYSREEIDIISWCVMRHNGKLWFQNYEEEIVANADASSKVLYHEAFALLCKKEGYEEKARWCQKYLEKWWSLITLDLLRERARPKYEAINDIYDQILVER